MRDHLIRILVVALLGCRAKALEVPPAPTGPLGGSRPVLLQGPQPSPAAPAPLIIVLHGYGADGTQLAGVAALARARGWFSLAPSGTPDSEGRRFWNATPACCDFDERGPDDVAYLDGLVAEAIASGRVDAARVYVVGFSNGGFMAQRLACDGAHAYAAVVSLAGGAPDLERCSRPAGTSVLLIHGTEDSVVPYGGGPVAVGTRRPVGGAEHDLAGWAARGRCGSPGEAPHRRDPCDGGAVYELWPLDGEGHQLRPDPARLETLLDWLASRRAR